MTKLIKAKEKNGRRYGLLLRTLFVVGIIVFLMYGLSFFLVQPTVQTIITPPPRIGNNNNQPPEKTPAHSVKKTR